MAAILQLIRHSASASNPETAALRAEVEGLRLALSLAQEALREERADKEHWRDQAKGRWDARSLHIVIASAAKQSRIPPRTQSGLLRRYAPRNDDWIGLSA